METEEAKKMTLPDILEYAEKRGLNAEALLKLEQTYRELLEPEKSMNKGLYSDKIRK